MSALTILLANVLPALCAGLVVLSLWRGRLDRNVLGFSLAAGFFLGAGLVAGLGWLTRETGWGPVPGALGLMAAAGLGAALAWRRMPGPGPGQQAANGGWLWWLLLALLLAGGLLSFHEAVLRPVYPWDAWSAWLVKTRVWLESGPKADFVSFPQWLAAGSSHLYTSEAWQYPELVPRFSLWVLQWEGRWSDAAALSPWLFAAIAMLLCAYHGLRLLGAGPLAAMAITYFIGAIPILNVQIALPGLVDLWIAAELLLYALLVMLWIRTRQSGWLALALAALAILAATKLEGVVWAGVLLLVPFFCLENRRLRLGALVLMAAGAIAWWITGGFSLSLPGGLRITMTPELIELPYLGRFPIEFSNQFAAFARSYLLLPNWHAAGYVLLPAIVLAAWLHRGSALGRGLLALSAVGLGLIFVLFFLTHAGMWAASMTASNRLGLQFIPACLAWAGYLLHLSAAPRGDAVA